MKPTCFRPAMPPATPPPTLPRAHLLFYQLTGSWKEGKGMQLVPKERKGKMGGGSEQEREKEGKEQRHQTSQRNG